MAPMPLVVESPDTADIWADVGTRWRILEIYFKPYPVCRWAQPAIRAVLDLRAAHAFPPDAVASVDIHTFHEAVPARPPCPGRHRAGPVEPSFTIVSCT